MSDPERERFRADLARLGITPSGRDFEAALRTARFLTASVRRVREYLDRAGDDPSR